MSINKVIPYGRQNISNKDIEAVIETLQSDWLTQGPAISQFEDAIKIYCGAKHAVACCNATAALHLACLALDVTEKDIVWTSPNTFLSSANCARFCGAEVDFVDIDSQTYNLCPQKLEEKLIVAKREDRLPKVVIPVHFSGQSCDMERIFKLSKSYGFRIIEDASHAIGASYQNKKVGDCRYADITVFSFHPVKIITTGEGGAALTNSDELIQKMRLLLTHGMTRDENKMQQKSPGAWYYEQIDLGYNYRITDMQCALGLSQLNRLDSFVERRHELVNYYNRALQNLPLILPYQHGDTYSSYHLYVICLDPTYKNKSREILFSELRKANIGVNVHYIPVHTQPYYQSLGFNWGDFPIAENYYQHAITLPLYPDMTKEQQDYVIDTLRDCLR